jgi:hypothetical protein
MSSRIFYKQWKLVLIDTDENKIDKLNAIIESKVHHFPDTSSFIDHLNTMRNAHECLILLVAINLIQDLPADIEHQVHKLYIYGGKNDDQIQPFDNICLHLSNLIIAQCTEQSIRFHQLNENGPARAFAEESIFRSKIFIRQLQELCDDIDEQISFGQENS